MTKRDPSWSCVFVTAWLVPLIQMDYKHRLIINLVTRSRHKTGRVPLNVSHWGQQLMGHFIMIGKHKGQRRYGVARNYRCGGALARGPCLRRIYG